MLTQIQKVTLIGGGSWATALAHVLSYNIPRITLLVRDPHVVNSIQSIHCNTKYFPDYTLAPSIGATTSFSEAYDGADVIIYASAMQHARSLLEASTQYIPPHAIIVSASKGIEEHTMYTMYDVIALCLPTHLERTCVLSGPSFAKEVLENKFTTLVVAGKHEDTALTVQKMFSTPTFKLYRSSDIIGVELAGAIKNVIAIATGIVDEVQQSYNARAGLIARGLAEMARLGLALGAEQQTFMGLAGIGDLLLTCTGELSRNRYVGTQLGKGLTMEAILHQMNNIAEGVYTCNAVHALSKKHAIYMPITEAVYNLLHGTKTIEDIYTIFSSPTHKQEYL
ncbi:MAG: NAD(P)-dependent glycerol-3-phosphate dehydrogenase [Desulfovibrionaceae bacterium]|nr:NAD(P)-dependent glycerol-3-phosphate dehydrogenase [Desulfovibrionaceae bacterium]